MAQCTDPHLLAIAYISESHSVAKAAAGEPTLIGIKRTHSSAIMFASDIFVFHPLRSQSRFRQEAR